MKHRMINRCASQLHRMSQRYYDRALEKHRIGCGQQFFLIEIANSPGITVQELARRGNYDNGCATRAAQKLEAQGYIRIQPDERDRRMRRMYATELAQEPIRDTLAAKAHWQRITLHGLSEAEIDVVERVLCRMVESARAYVKGGSAGEDLDLD